MGAALALAARHRPADNPGALRQVDLLVNNAGVCGSQAFEDATLED